MPTTIPSFPPANAPEAQRALRDLTESRELLSVTLASIGDAVITTDGRGVITFLNPAAESLTGWSRQDSAGLPLDRVFWIVNENTRARVESPTVRALREGIVVGLANSTLLIAKDGTERPIDDSAAPIRDASGGVAGVVLVFRDVTERKQREKLVKESLEYAQNILATQREPFLVLDGTLRVVSANRAFYRTFHATPEETEGRLLRELGDGQWNVPELSELLDEVLPQHHAFDDFEIEHDFERGVGKRVMLLNARHVRRPGNHSELILLAIEDITERKLVAQKLHESEVRYHRLFQSAKDGILILDSETRKIIDANPFVSGLTGLEHDEVLGKELYELGMFTDVEENKAAFVELQRTGYLRYEHLPMQNQRGERVEVEFIANVYREDDRLVAQCNVRDISDRVDMEKRLVAQAESLAGESRRKDEFLAMLSHELRNPLAPIRSAVHVLKLQDRGDNAMQRRAREIIERQVANLTKLVSDLLEVSRVVTGRIRLDQQVVDMRQVVQHAVDSVRSSIDQRRHELVVRYCPEPAWVNADAMRMEEVFVNLLNNAVKYTDDGGHIEVDCEHDRDRVLVRVRDDGIGIDEKTLPHVFDLFTQAKHTLHRSDGGLGIGLSLAQRLVRVHDGTIEVRSPPAGRTRGSELVVHLPLVLAPERAVVAEPTAEAPHESGLRALVVDDNLDQVAMVASALRHKGYRVQTAHTGPDGLEVAQRWRPDIVLLDIGLPGLDGYEVARRLRTGLGQDGKQMRLFALSGYGRDTDIALAREAGFEAHLTKPCDLDELERLMLATHTTTERPRVQATMSSS